MHKWNYAFNNLHSFEFMVSILLFSLIIGVSVNYSSDWKNAISEGKYVDFTVKTQSTIKSENPNFLNYTVQVAPNDPSGIRYDYYPILEFENNVKKIGDRQTNNGNITKQFDIFLEEGKNKWSLVIEPHNPNISKILHHGEFDETQY